MEGAALIDVVTSITQFVEEVYQPLTRLIPASTRLIPTRTIPFDLQKKYRMVLFDSMTRSTYQMKLMILDISFNERGPYVQMINGSCLNLHRAPFARFEGGIANRFASSVLRHRKDGSAPMVAQPLLQNYDLRLLSERSSKICSERGLGFHCDHTSTTAYQPS